MTAAALANRIWRLAAWPSYVRFEAAWQDPIGCQDRLLAGLVKRNASSWFGRRHDFDRISNIESFQARVPVSSYHDYEAAIERIRAGETNVLTSEPVLRFVPTSGTGSARKRIPYTRSLFREFDRGLSAWITMLSREVPAAFDGRAYWAISPPAEVEGKGKVPEGFSEDHEYLGPVGNLLRRSVLAVDRDFDLAAGIAEFRRQTLRQLVSRDDLSLISVWHPSFLLLLLEGLRESLPILVSELPGHRERLRRALDSPEPLVTRVLWPRLALVSCWLDGPSARDAETLQALFPHALFQAKGLLATEGVVTLPYGLSGIGVPAITSHFLEFLDAAGKASLAGELQPGHTYEVLLTTGGGLYRYRLGDRVRVVSREGGLPLLAFVGRAGIVSDHFGEKLDEELVETLVGDLIRRSRVTAANWFLAFERGVGCYVLFIEAGEGGLLASLAGELDEVLCHAYHYALARRLGQLAKARVYAFEPASRERIYSRFLERGTRPGEAKPGALSRLGGWPGILDGGFVESPSGTKPQ